VFNIDVGYQAVVVNHPQHLRTNLPLPAQVAALLVVLLRKQ
jgi:hypothetical protein